MSESLRAPAAFLAIAAALIAVGFLQSWSVSLSIANLCLISAIMALGLNMQWGYAGLFNAGVMGFAALGGLAAVLVSTQPVSEAWRAGGLGLLASGLVLALAIAAIVVLRRKLAPGRARLAASLALAFLGFLLARALFVPAVSAIEAVDPSRTGFLGGMGLPILLSWPAGALLAAAAAWLIGRIALGLRADYFAIATLGIAEIALAIVKNEDWLARGVKNVSGLDRPVPYEIDLQQEAWLQDLARWLEGGALTSQELARSAAELSGVMVKLAYFGLFAGVLLFLLFLAQRALHSPWGRTMHAIRDNEDAAAALGKDVTARHREVFILGSAVIGLGGAMLTTLDGQFTPGSYNPLRFTFLIWVMVIIGGSGNNLGAILGGFVIWFVWIQAEPLGGFALDALTAALDDDHPLRQHLLGAAPHARLLLMGLTLLLVMRFSPRGLIPERAGGGALGR